MISMRSSRKPSLYFLQLSHWLHSLQFFMRFQSTNYKIFKMKTKEIDSLKDDLFNDIGNICMDYNKRHITNSKNRITWDEPMIACPVCKMRCYATRFSEDTCYCVNCGHMGSVEYFELEGMKWDNEETANCY